MNPSKDAHPQAIFCHSSFAQSTLIPNSPCTNKFNNEHNGICSPYNLSAIAECNCSIGWHGKICS